MRSGCQGICWTRCARWTASSVLRAAFGDAFLESYLRVKHRDWNEHAAVLTDFERRATLDC